MTIENRELTEELAFKNRTLELANQKLQNVNRKLEEDVQRRKRLEASLRESEERFRKFTTASQDIIVLFDVGGKGLYSNPAAERLLGYTHTDFVNKPLTTSLHPDYRKVVREEVAMLLVSNNPPQAREVKIQKSDKTYLDVELNFFCISLESGERIVGSIWISMVSSWPLLAVISCNALR